MHPFFTSARKRAPRESVTSTQADSAVRRDQANSLTGSRYIAVLAALCALCSLANAQTLILGIDPMLPEPTPEYLEDRSELERKKFGKVRYERVEPISKTQAWNAVIGILAADSGIDLLPEPSSSQLDFELKLAKGHYDLAYMNPLQFVSFNHRSGYKAIAKRKAQPLRGLVVVKAESQVSNLRDIEGQVIVFPGLLDFQSSIAPRESLKKLGIAYIPHILAGPEEAYQSVLSGVFSAAAGTIESLNTLPPPKRQKLRIIWDTPGYTPHAFAAHTRVSFYVLTRLQKALVSLIKTDTGKKILPLIHARNGFEVAKDSDWHDARQIDLSALNSITPYRKDSGTGSAP